MKILNAAGDYNLHTHSIYDDGKDDPECMVKRAIELGFRRIGFSGHEYAPYDIDVCMTLENTKRYRKQITELKEKYRDQIEVLLGIERDYYCEPDDFPYDYVIGSVHYVKKDGVYVCVEDTKERLIEEVDTYFHGDMRALVEAYYEVVGDVCEKTGCDIVGHFDVVKKFNRGGALFDEESTWYKRAAIGALARAAKHKPIFEINYAGVLRGYREVPYPSDFLINEIDRLGCAFVLSSDCHNREYLNYGLDAYREG